MAVIAPGCPTAIFNWSTLEVLGRIANHSDLDHPRRLNPITCSGNSFIGRCLNLLRVTASPPSVNTKRTTVPIGYRMLVMIEDHTCFIEWIVSPILNCGISVAWGVWVPGKPRFRGNPRKVDMIWLGSGDMAAIRYIQSLKLKRQTAWRKLFFEKWSGLLHPRTWVFYCKDRSKPLLSKSQSHPDSMVHESENDDSFITDQPIILSKEILESKRFGSGIIYT